METIQIRNEILNEPLIYKPTRFDMAVSFYCCLKNKEKYLVVGYYYNPIWDLYFPFYDDVNKKPILKSSTSTTYKELVEEFNTTMIINQEEKLKLAKERFKKLIGCECCLLSDKAIETYELKYSKTTGEYTIYKFFNYVISSGEDLDKVLTPVNLDSCKLFDLDNLVDTKMVSNAKHFCSEYLDCLKENSIEIDSEFNK